jgi:hypothetical protein
MNSRVPFLLTATLPIAASLVVLSFADVGKSIWLMHILLICTTFLLVGAGQFLDRWIYGSTPANIIALLTLSGNRCASIEWIVAAGSLGSSGAIESLYGATAVAIIPRSLFGIPSNARQSGGNRFYCIGWRKHCVGDSTGCVPSAGIAHRFGSSFYAIPLGFIKVNYYLGSQCDSHRVGIHSPRSSCASPARRGCFCYCAWAIAVRWLCHHRQRFYFDFGPLCLLASRPCLVSCCRRLLCGAVRLLSRRTDTSASDRIRCRHTVRFWTHGSSL